MMGPAFKAPPPAGAEGDAVWHDEQRLTVLVRRTERPIAGMTHAEAVLDDPAHQEQLSAKRIESARATLALLASSAGTRR